MKNYILLFVLVTASGMMMGQMKVIQDGKVKIGNTGVDPQSELDVNGTIRTSINAANYSSFENEANGLRLGIAKKSSGNALIDINPLPASNTNSAKFRFFRETNTNANVSFDVHYGDGTSGVNCQIGANTNTLLNRAFGNVMIGSGAPTHKLSVNGDASKVGGGTWATFSDKNLKKNVKNYERGLKEILLIRPVWFQYNGDANIKDTETSYVGVIAQEMQKIAPSTVKSVKVFDEVLEGDELNGKVKKIKEKSFLSFDANEITYMLVNAIQEQQEVINKLQDEILTLRELMDNGVGQVVTPDNTKDIVLGLDNVSTLSQNQPNPYKGITVIDYSIADLSENASITFYSVNGQMVKNVVLNDNRGSLRVTADDLPAGTYTYHLIVDGQLIEAKKMVVTQ